MTAPVMLQGNGRFEIDIVGESNYEDHFETICGERTPDGEDRMVDAVLILDDSNPYDPNAVRVDIEGYTVGYLSRDVAPHFRKHMAALGHKKAKSFQCRANIRGGWDRGGGDTGNYGVRLDLPRGDEASVPAIATAPEKKKRGCGKTILYLVVILVVGFVACVVLGMILQALGLV